MRWSIIPLVVLAILVGTSPSSEAVVQPEFVGSWYGFDPDPPAGDGSFMSLTITPTGSGYAVRLVDTLATGACEPAARVTLRGTARSRGADLLFSFTSVRCDAGAEPQLSRGFLRFSLQPDGTLLDNFGVTWSRTAR